MIVEWVLPALALLFGIVSLITAIRSLRARRLRYYLPIRRRLFSNRYLEHGDFNLKLNSSPVADLFLAQVDINNVGTQPIRRQDLIGPLSLTFDRHVRPFPVKFERRRADIPIGYDVEQTDEATVLRIYTPLIETDDQIRITFLYESSTYADYKLAARIVDGSLVKGHIYEEAVDEDFHYGLYRRFKRRRSWAAFPILLISGITGAGILAAILALLPPSFRELIDGAQPWAVALSILVVAALGGAMADRLSRRTVEKPLLEEEADAVRTREEFEERRSAILRRLGHPYPEVNHD